jgi:hypothetical protein
MKWRHKRRQQRVGDAESRLASFISAPEFFAFSTSSPFIRFGSETLTPPYFACQLKYVARLIPCLLVNSLSATPASPSFKNRNDL